MERALLERLSEYPRLVVSWLDDDGYPTQTAASFSVRPDRGELVIAATGLPAPTDREVNIVASHIRPMPGWGYDQRRYVSLWGRLEASGGELVLREARNWGWDEDVTPFFEYVERSNPQAKRYMETLSRERGTEVKPRLSPVWTFLLATRLPFLTATIVPVLLGIAVAGRDGFFNLGYAALTVIAGAAVHIGLNVANDVFDTLSGADDANSTPTQFSGGSRVIQRGLLSLKQMVTISVVAYTLAIVIGVALVIVRESWELLAIGGFGVLISFFYTAPPLRLVHRGLGEITTALGFGPVMVLGAYVVQAQRWSWEALVVSIPVAIMIALVLYVNEIPDRRSDASVGKRTLPTRWRPETVRLAYMLSVAAAFGVVVVGALFHLFPYPTLIALASVPLAVQVYRGMQQHYDRPYDLMADMGKNVQLHLVSGMLLFLGYIVQLVASGLFDSPPTILQ